VAHRLLLGSDFPPGDLAEVARYGQVYRISAMGEEELDEILPSVDCLLVALWPGRLDRSRLSRMSSLSLVQSVLAGVNHVPFGDLPKGAVVCSNAGGYSVEVGEFAWGLLLAAAKRIVKLEGDVRRPGYSPPRPLELGREVVVLRGKAMGVLGYGGIGRVVAGLGRAFGMDVSVFSRTKVDEPGLVSEEGGEGLRKVLRSSDAVVVTLPLTRATERLIGAAELSMMKRDAILVNVSRAEVVDQDAVYDHLTKNPRFVYATDVWWLKDGRESYAPRLPFLELENFIGTPHVSGPSASVGGGPLRNAVANVLRFVRGEPLVNVVDREEYEGTD
jgi:phosphoglycerate dehydrogenase-like enzyme